MHQYNSDSLAEFEELVAEFIAYKKSSTDNSDGNSMDCEIGEGWPHYKLSDFEKEEGLDGMEYGFNPVAMEAGKEPVCNNFTGFMPDMLNSKMILTPDETKNQPQSTQQENLMASNNNENTNLANDDLTINANQCQEMNQPIPGAISDDEILHLDVDMDYMRSLMNEINSRIYPFVIEVLNEYDYEGSPIFNERMDKEFIAQLVDKIIERAAAEIEEAAEAHQGMDRGIWNRYRLFRSVIEISLLNELFGCRRPRFRRVCGCGAMIR